MKSERPRNMDEFSSAIGLSRPTVSKYFNDPQSVRAATRARIERFMHELDYSPNFYALNQNRRSSKTIGIVVPNLLDPFFEEIVRRIETRAVEAGYWPILIGCHGSADFEARAFESLRSLRVAGAVVAPLGDATDLERLERLRAEVPVVLLDTLVPGNFPFVGTDNEMSIGQMVSYLCATGTPPCYLGLPEFNTISRERREVYVRSVTAAGHAPRIVQTARDGWD